MNSNFGRIIVADYLPAGVSVYFHSENGILGMGRRARVGEEDYDLVDAMKVPVTLMPGASPCGIEAEQQRC